MISIASGVSGSVSAKPIRDPLSYSLEDIKDHFDERISILRNICDTIIKSLTDPLMADLLWQEQMTSACTSLDYYLHKFHLYALYSMYIKKLKWYQTEKFKKEELAPIQSTLSKQSADMAKVIFVESKREKYKQTPFLSSEMIMEIMETDGMPVEMIQNRAFPSSKSSPSGKKKHKKLNKKLEALIDQRHILVHSENRNPDTDIPKDTSDLIVKQFLNECSSLVEAIHYYAGQKET